MAKIAFFNIPAYGHTNPTLAVVRDLTSRGHCVSYYSYESFRERIEAAGARFIGCDTYDAQLGLGPEDGARIAKDTAFSIHVLVETTLALDAMVCREMERERPDCLVADSMAVWGKAAALKLDIPFVSSTTTFAFNRESAKLMKQSAGQTLAMLLSIPKMNRDVRRLEKLGYSIKSFLQLMANDRNTDTVVYTSPEFQPCYESFSEKYAFVGPCILPPTSSFEKNRERLVYISMGTVNNNIPEVYKNSIAAAADMDAQVLISVGALADIDSLGKLPENVQLKRWVDQTAVLKEADVFLSHCGMNSASESLYFGVPLLCYPQTAEQGAVAARICRLGAGKTLASPSAEDIKAGLKLLMEEGSFRANAEKIGESFRRCGGARAAADKIESMIK